jgi:hypothetical protein
MHEGLWNNQCLFVLFFPIFPIKKGHNLGGPVTLPSVILKLLPFYTLCTLSGT